MNEDKLNQLLDTLKIDKRGKLINGKYVISLNSSDDYSKIYTILDKSDELYLDTESIVLSSETSLMTYLAEEFDLILKADFDTDNYYLIIEEANI